MKRVSKYKPGDLNLEFNGGKVDLSHLLKLPNDKVKLVALKPTLDGALLVAGGTLLSGARCITKFTKAGNRDQAFGEDGVIDVNAFQSLQVAGDGSFYMADKLDRARLFVQKYLPNGNLDSSYGQDGVAIVDFAPVDQRSVADVSHASRFPEIGDSVTAMLSGKSLYLVSASVWGGWGGFRTVVARLNENGVLDQAFGENGVYHFDSKEFGFSLPRGVDRQKTLPGREDLLLMLTQTGEYLGQPGLKGYLVRFTGGETIDEQFGENGFYTFEMDEMEGVDFFVDEDQRIKLHGIYPGRADLRIIGLSKDGKLDGGFNNGQELIIPAPPETIFGSNLRSHGVGETYRFVFHSATLAESAERTQVRRYLESGLADSHFGESGIVTLPRKQSEGFALLMPTFLEPVTPDGDLIHTTLDDIYWLLGS